MCRCGEWVRRLQSPTSAVFGWRLAVAHREVAAKGQAAPPAVKANNEVPAIRSVERDSRCRDHGDFGGFSKLGQGSVDDGDKVGEFARWNLVVLDVAADNLGDVTGIDCL